jgi:hypothetical protein
MTHNDSREADELLEIENLLTEDQRRPLSVAAHYQFREELCATNHNDEPVITREWLMATMSPLVRQFHEDSSEYGEDFLDDDEIFALLVSDLSQLIATSCQREMILAQELTGGTIEQ